MLLDLLDSKVICSELGVVNAEVDASVDTCGILDLQERNKQALSHFERSVVSLHCLVSFEMNPSLELD